MELDPNEIKIEQGNYPLHHIVPFGPKFSSKTDAEMWLEKNQNINVKYVIWEIYGL